VAISGNQWQSVAISGNQWQSVVMGSPAGIDQKRSSCPRSFVRSTCHIGNALRAHQSQSRGHPGAIKISRSELIRIGAHPTKRSSRGE
jgi:hypothetical protein